MSQIVATELDLMPAVIGVRKYRCGDCDDVHDMTCYDGELAMAILNRNGFDDDAAFAVLERLEQDELATVVWLAQLHGGSLQ